MSRTAFITGATGVVGLNIVEELVAQGWSVTALHRPSSQLRRLRRFDVQLRVGSLSDEQSLVRAIPDGVDAVFHVAANISFWRPRRQEQYRDNVWGTRNVLRAAMKRKAGRFIHTSSVAAFGNLGHHITEDTVSDAKDHWIGYCRTKYLAEQEVHQAIERGLEAVILNPANVIGAYDERSWGRAFTVIHAESLPGAPPGIGSFCDATEVARAHLAAVDRGRVGHNYLLGGVDHSYLEVFQKIGQLLGKPTPKRATPALVLKAIVYASEGLSLLTRQEPPMPPGLAAIFCDRFTCSSDKAKNELRYQTPPLEYMLRTCWEWMKKEGLLSK